MRSRRLIAVVVAVVLAVGLLATLAVWRAGSSGEKVTPTPVRYPAAVPTRRETRAAPPPPASVYERAIDEAHRQGLAVWIDTQMIFPWRRGGAAFDDAVARIGHQARRPGVTGIKFADEVGGADGLRTPSEIRRFLADTSRALRAAAPGVPLLVDIYVPEFGCLPGDKREAAARCRSEFRRDYPLLTAENVESYLLGGWVDAVHLAPDLRDRGTYTGWGTTWEDAQRAYWREVARRGWAAKVRLYGRTAGLAHSGRWSKDRGATERLVFSEADLLFDGGAQMVHLWTWRQFYEGEYRQLTDPGLTPNTLWAALRARRAAGARFSTLFLPDEPQSGLEADLGMLREVFSEVFLWTGVGTP